MPESMLLATLPLCRLSLDPETETLKGSMGAMPPKGLCGPSASPSRRLGLHLHRLALSVNSDSGSQLTGCPGVDMRSHG